MYFVENKKQDNEEKILFYLEKIMEQNKYELYDTC